MYNDKIRDLDIFGGLLDTMVSDLKNVNTEFIWSGSASDRLISNFDNSVESFRQYILKLKKYCSVLKLMKEYENLDLQIQSLEAQLSSCTGDDDESLKIRAMLLSQINNLKTKKNMLELKISSYLKEINEPIAETDANPMLIPVVDEEDESDNESEDVTEPETEIEIEEESEIPSEIELEPKSDSLYNEVPLIYQSDYTNVNYGTGTIATHGCGITSLAMVASYYSEEEIMPDQLVEKYRTYGSKSGTNHMIFEQTADELNLPFQEHVHYSTEKDLQKVVESLDEGCVIVAKAKSSSIFTNSGHYIVLTGVTEDGKITVNDPNKYNYPEFNEWCGDTLADGYANGFDQEQFKYGKIQDFFIYSPKS